MNNILRPKEWLNYINEREGSKFSIYDCDYLIMERYANYVTRELQAKIFEFRRDITEDLYIDEGGLVTIYKGIDNNLTLLDFYNKHFNITTKTNGK